MLISALDFLVVMLACTLNDRMQKELDYTQAEVRVLKEVVKTLTGNECIPFTDPQRRRLAILGKDLTPKERTEVCEIVKPATILAWFRNLVAKKYDGSGRRGPGRPRTATEKRELVIQIAKTNPGWGYSKIRDALRGLKINVGRTTIADILKDAGLEPAPERDKKRTWKQFMRSHRDSLYACDFFSVETLGLFGPVRQMVFFVIEVRTRVVEIVGIRVDPDGEWMKQMARNLIDCFDGFLVNAKYLIHDRDPLFTEAFRALLRSSGIEPIKLPARSSDLNPHAERFVKSIKYECLNHFVFFGERHLRYVIKEYMAHYLEERFHQGLDGQLIRSKNADDGGVEGSIRCRQRLGGLLNYYHRKAA
ncbi:integrase core domain-containing protein [Myxococcota bacterium]